ALAPGAGRSWLRLPRARRRWAALPGPRARHAGQRSRRPLPALPVTRDPTEPPGFELRAFDGSLERHAAELAARLEINCVIDAGAHAGQGAHSLRRAGHAGPIGSFQAMRASFERLRET